jgi:hypothetical protein
VAVSGVFLVGLVAIFGRFERGRERIDATTAAANP